MTIKRVGIPGRRFRCRVRYAFNDGLDRLATFVLESLKFETKIANLVGAFGLPQRMIEDVIAELVQRNYAVLDVSDGRVRPVRDGEATTRRYETSPFYQEIWGDDVTGALLPANVVDRANRAAAASGQKESFELQRSETADLFDFRYIPDARIVSMLHSTSPTYLTSGGAARTVDALVEKELIGEEVLLAPIVDTTIESHDDSILLESIDVGSVPSWLCRQWTKAYRSQTAETTQAFQPREVAFGEKPYLILEETDLTSWAARWLSALNDLIADSNAAPSHAEFQLENERRIELADRLQDASGSSLAIQTPARGGSHVADLWDEAQHYLLLVVGCSGSDELFSELVSQTVDRVDKKCALIVMFAENSETSREECETLSTQYSTRFTNFHACVARAMIEPELALRDGAAATFGSLPLLLSTAPACSLKARRLSSGIVSVLGSHVAENKIGRIIGRAHGPDPVKAWTRGIVSDLETIETLNRSLRDYYRRTTQTLNDSLAWRESSDEESSDDSPEASAESATEAFGIIEQLSHLARKVVDRITTQTIEGEDVVICLPYFTGCESLNEALLHLGQIPDPARVEFVIAPSRVPEFAKLFGPQLAELFSAEWSMGLVLAPCEVDELPGDERRRIRDCFNIETLAIGCSKIRLPEMAVINQSQLILGPFSDTRSSSPIVANSRAFITELSSYITWV